MDRSEDNFLFYNPNIFDELKIFIHYLNDFENKLFCKNQNEFFNEIKNNLILHKTLENIGVFKAVEIAFKSSVKPLTRQKHLKTWFDGFRTLKFIHAMRDLAYPSIPLKKLIKQPLYQPLNLSETLSLEELLKQFKKFDCHLTTDNI